MISGPHQSLQGMNKVIAEISMSLDGYVAGRNQTLEQPLGEGGELLHEWAFGLKTFREAHGMEGGETGPDDDLMAEAWNTAGAFVMGRRMFSGGSGPWENDQNAGGWWANEPPFRRPVFVLTHHQREPLVVGETTFTFVTNGIESAIEQARAAAGDRNVEIGGGAETIDQALAAGVADELLLHVVPVVLGAGARLFANVERRSFERVDLRPSPTGVTHLRFRTT
jgi:dihydrofolate reductase